MNIKMIDWDWGQYKAAGRNVASYAAGGVTVALAWGLVSANDASQLQEGISTIASGAEQMAKGIGMVAGVLVPMYTAWRAAHSASPKAQAKAVVDNLADPHAPQAIASTDDRNKLINAVSMMPEVKQIVATTDVALSTPSAKVVAVNNAPRV